MTKKKLHYRFEIKKDYIIMFLSGELTEDDMKESSDELLRLAEENQIKKVIYMPETLAPAMPKLRKKGMQYFKQVSKKMDKMASVLTDNKLYVVVKLLYAFDFSGKWKVFMSLDKAIEWITQD